MRPTRDGRKGNGIPEGELPCDVGGGNERPRPLRHPAPNPSRTASTMTTAASAISFRKRGTQKRNQRS